MQNITEYEGMRCLKCDLHMHTPEESRNCNDAETKLLDPRRPKIHGVPDENDIQGKARIFLKTCHDVGLNVIGVTDHNFSAKSETRDWFIVHLIEQNNRVAEELDKEPLIIFPGFEVDIGYHMLCLFPPVKKQKGLENYNSALTKLGLSEKERFTSSGSAEQLRHNEQTVSLKTLIEIVQGEHAGIVIAAHGDQNSGILNDSSNHKDYGHPELYCVELTANSPAQRYQNILNGQDISWSRESFHPAVIMSSDNKKLIEHNDDSIDPVPNSIGYRYTWIKMSEPSIESLRQAFLDHESRISLPEDVWRESVLGLIPEYYEEKHARIVSVSISNAKFLEDQSISFSPNLNCLIGGRGSGKSTILEAMRLAMGKDKDPKLYSDERTKEKIDRIKKLLNARDDTSVRVRLRDADSLEDSIVYSNGSHMLDGRELTEPDLFLKDLPIQFFSQQQLNRITENKSNMLLSLLDDFIYEELKELRRRESEITSKIRHTFAQADRLFQLESDISEIKQESEELERQWKARSSLKEEAEKHRGLKAAQSYISKLQEAIKEDGERLLEVASDIAESHSPLGSMASKWPDGKWFIDKDDHILTAKETMQVEVAAAVTKYQTTVKELFSKDNQWSKIQKQIRNADDDFSMVCREKGISKEDIGRLKEIDDARTLKKRELEAKEKEQEKLKRVENELSEQFLDLQKLWWEMYSERKKVAKNINRSARDRKNKSVIELQIGHSADESSFMSIWRRLAPDGRSRLGKKWEDVGVVFHGLYVDKYLGEPQVSAFPWQMLQSFLDTPIFENIGNKNDLSFHNTFKEEVEGIDISFDEIKAHLDKTKEWREVQLTRVNDFVDLTLYRADGKEVAGKVSDGTLSDGQRNTAALAMLLAQGKHPLVMDQPEDELDANFIFSELVAMLRRLKNERQIILATHNANLPVNGDAELVYALETKDGHGRKLAEGGLDRQEVAGAVLDIMEGSETAFRKRREKYHF